STSSSSGGSPQYTFYMGGGASQSQAFWSTVAKGFLDGCAALNCKGVYVGPDTAGDVSSMLNEWTTIAATKPDGFSGTFYSPSLAQPALQMLNAGIPVVANNAATFDSNGNIVLDDASTTGYQCYIGENSIATGVVCATELLNAYK